MNNRLRNEINNEQKPKQKDVPDFESLLNVVGDAYTFRKKVIDEIINLCKQKGTDIDEVAAGLMADSVVSRENIKLIVDMKPENFDETIKNMADNVKKALDLEEKFSQEEANITGHTCAICTLLAIGNVIKKEVDSKK